MSDSKKHRITLTELEMQLILETLVKTPYLGEHSYVVSNIRDKLTIEPKE